MRGLLLTSLVTWAVLAVMVPSPGLACGGLFCNSTQSLQVNQAAERIIFSVNDDGTVTSVIQIMYQGAADKFAWVLPVPGVPEVAVSSDQVFTELQQLTNPTYTLTTTTEGTCGSARLAMASSAPVGDFGNTGVAGGAAPVPQVMVEAEGNVGPYDYTVISVVAGAQDTADVAIEWLTDNGYDVGELGPEVLRPYLDSGLNLLAFRLTKGNEQGSIRPVMLTYDGELPSIPIRPTAVAANDDMGVMVWLVTAGRAVPSNYKTLVLNEARIDWFNPMGTYNDVVTMAADEAEGQGFVTEFSGPAETFADAIFPAWQRDEWNSFQSSTAASGIDLLLDAAQRYGSWDGFSDAIDESVTLPTGVELNDLLLCVNCYADEPGFSVDVNALIEGLYINVIKPVLDTHDLLLSQSTVTRLYTTMSASEMTLDPIFDVNPDLPEVSNIHTATRIIECGDGGDRALSPWRVELPQGDVVRGMGTTWPLNAEQPAARLILQLSRTGDGVVIRDNGKDIADLLSTQNADFSVGNVIVTPGGGPNDPDDPMAMDSNGSLDSCGCRAPGSALKRPSHGALLAALPVLLLLRRRRRSRLAEA